jgi:hypothetical protein
MKERYSSGGTLRSVPGIRRSTRRGDWPEDTLEVAVALLCRLLMRSEPKVLWEPAKEAGANESTGDIDCGVTRYGDERGTAQALLSAGVYEDCGKDVCRGKPWVMGYCEDGG